VPTKLPHYVLPLYPALALLAGQALARGAARPTAWLDGIVFALWAVFGLILGVGPLLLFVLLGSVPGALGLVPAVAAIGAGLVLLRRLAAGFSANAVPIIALTSVLVFAPSFAVLLPGLDALWLSRSAASLIAQHPPPPGSAIDTVGYNEPSLVFLLNGATRAATPDQAAADLAARPGALALVMDRDDAEFRARLAARGLAPVLAGAVSGIAYSRSSARVTLALYGAAPQ